ncbi:MAG: hypothetical protein D8B53_05905 [Corynebacterium sp.]|nr:MAG: hypothetical protein D8B53_05905 [Corynebacterium sp.]DAT19534.1 MAG TPA: protein of unknown function (DUF5361) [Caudoviricetes sp.]
MGIDYRDFWRPKGGDSRLTLRRLLVLVDGLDRTRSRFWSEILDIDRLSIEGYILADIFAAITSGERHPMATMREGARKQKALEERKERYFRIKAERERKLALAKGIT